VTTARSDQSSELAQFPHPASRWQQPKTARQQGLDHQPHRSAVRIDHAKPVPERTFRETSSFARVW
jgi:hypothetical protein